jgi:hypothetical protein
VQAHRIAQKVVEAKGGKGFLGNTAGSSLYCDMQSNFNETFDGSRATQWKKEKRFSSMLVYSIVVDG